MTPFLTHPSFNATSIRYGFFTREGGVSEGLYASLNCSLGSNDDPEKVRENNRRVAHAMQVPPQHLVTCYQIHSPTALIVERPWEDGARPQADALVTNKKGLALGIRTADCAPVLFHDEKNNVIGAAHAGWKGALNGVLENTLSVMRKLGGDPASTKAIIGACIQQASYEVGPEFPTPFLAQNADNSIFFKESNRAGHALFDLPAYIQQRLRHAGLTQIYSLGLDTCTDETRFFSYRRRTLRREPDMGTMLSTIVLS